MKYIVEYKTNAEASWDSDEIFSTFEEAFSYATSQVVEFPSFEHRIIRRSEEVELMSFPRAEDC